MARLTGQAAIDYIKNNPKGAFKVTSGNLQQHVPDYAPPEKEGFLKRLAMGITKPFRNLAGQAVETGVEAGRVGGGLIRDIAQVQGGENVDRVLEDILGEQKVDWMQPRKEKVVSDLLLSDKEYRDYQRNPLGKGSQTAAGIASFAVPGALGKGSTALQMGKAGAVSGALGGFSEADLGDPGDVLKKTLGGSAFGGVTGFGIGKVGEVLQKGRVNKLTKGLNKDQGAIMEILDQPITKRAGGGMVDPYNAALETINGLDDVGRQANLRQQLANVVDATDAQGATVLEALNKYYDIVPTQSTPLTGGMINKKLPKKFDIVEEALGKARGQRPEGKFLGKAYDAGEAIELGAVKDVIGKPTPTQGGVNMLKRAGEIDGIILDSPELAYQTAQDVISTKGGVLNDAITDITEQGGGVSVADLDDFFTSLEKGAKVGPEREAIARVRADYMDDFLGDIQAEIGATSFRGTPMGSVDEVGAYFRTAEAQNFEKLVTETGEQFGDLAVTRTAGVWDGALEPSYSIQLTGSGEDALKYAANLGAKGNQDAIIMFAPGEGGDTTKYLFDTVSDPDAFIGQMQKNGIMGGTITDSGVVVYDLDGSLQGSLNQLSKANGYQPKATRGVGKLIERSDYAKYTTVGGDIAADISEFGAAQAIPLDRWNRIRQGVGEQAKFSKLQTAGEQTKAGINQQLYKFMQGKTDEALKSFGFEDLRPINREVSTAIDLRDFLKYQRNRGNINLPVGLMETTAAAGGLATGGPGGAIASAGLSKAVKSPTLRKGFGQGVQKMAARLAGVGGPTAPRITTGAIEQAGRVATPSLTRMAIGEPEVIDRPGLAPEIVGADGAPGADMAEIEDLKTEMVLQLVNTRKPGSKLNYSVSEAEKIAGYRIAQEYGVAPTAGEDLTPNERKIVGQAQTGINALDRIESMLLANPEVLYTGELPNIMRGSEGRQYAAEVERASEMFGRMQSGGAINAEEEVRFLNMLPKPFDDAATRVAKIRGLREQFEFVVG